MLKPVSALLLLAGGLLLRSPAAAQPQVVVYSNDTVAVGTTRQFTTYVNITPSSVVWAVNDITGGNATVGAISSTGLYQAPSVAPTPNNVVIVKATSTAQPSIFGTAQVTVQQPTPMIWGVSPSSFPAGSYSLRLNGSNFVPGAVVNLGGAPVATQYINAQTLVASGSLMTTGKYPLTVTNPAPGMVTSSPLNVTVQAVTATVTVSVAPTSATVNTQSTRQFTATVSNTSNTAVTWRVNDITGGNATVGTISAAGVYTAPATVPSPAIVTVKAVSAASSTAAGIAQVTVQAATPATPPVLTSVAPASLQTGSFTLTITGSGFVNGAVAQLDGAALAITFVSATQLSATGSTQASSGTVALTIRNPDGTTSNTLALPVQPATPTVASKLGAARFLEQATFGPTPALLQKVQQIGYDAFLTEQFATSETPIPIPSNNSFSTMQAGWLYTSAQAPDQLRQKMAYALSQILVVSGAKLNYADEYVPWLRLLSRNSFGNYRTVLLETTLNPSMGKYLDLPNSAPPAANENYPREVLQLFSIGLWQLNKDGSLKLDAQGQPIPTYNQATVRQFALALTGWTYSTAPGAAPQLMNWEYFAGNLESREASHDTSAKTLLNGVTLPAGQTTVQDLNGVVDCLFQHPNTPPFVAVRLIRALVKSNPSPAYISRIADVFIDNGSGVRGDLKAVLRAILLDPEARQDTADATSGRLREPIGHVIAMVRALNGQVAQANQFAWTFTNMSQAVLTPNSVFSFYSPLFRVPRTSLYGPEFQIYTPTESALRSNFIYDILTKNAGSDIQVDLTPYLNAAGNTAALLDAVDQNLLYGRMPPQMRTTLTTAIAQQPDNQSRMLTAVYLTLMSAQYAVQH